ncbi:ABC transporter substrate-binding protein [Azohydromonas aeria]|uniref:ABC transporter substrate-binding protein n=1 Tax=Azohydromonas aeria TaxID=2590212 RepID=UPI0012FCC983|nr:ABC transporter substrate-binding protein [Azohydromonas aeria]
MQQRFFRAALATLSLATLLPGAALAADTPAAAATMTKRVAVTAIVEHPALDAARDGVRDALKAAGYEPGKNLTFEYQSAQGNTGTAAQIARKYVGDRPDAIVAIATPSAQAAVAATRDIPVVFSAVTDPVAARLVKGWEPSGGNVTGVSDASPLDKHVELIKRVRPQARKVGVIYNPGEANSVAIVESLKKATAAAGLTLVEAAAPRTVDVPGAAQSLAGKADVIYAPTDNNVMSAFEGIVKVAQQAKLPVVAADTDAVKRGAVAALGLNYYELGRQTGQIVVRILGGEKPGAIAAQTSQRFELHVNPEAAQKQGVTLPEDLLKAAKVVVAQK